MEDASPIALLRSAATAIDAVFDRLTGLAMVHLPDAHVARRSSYNNNEAQVGLSVLEDPAADELTVEVQVVLRATQMWCELTVYIGQSSLVILSWGLWAQGQTPTNQVSSVVEDLFRITEPRIAHVIERMGHAARGGELAEK